MSNECTHTISAIVSHVGVELMSCTKMLHIDDTGGSCRCRKHTITHVDTHWNHYYMDTLLRTVSEMTLAKKTL